jgi:hypothetical protein
MVQDSNAWNRFTPPISDYQSGSGNIGSEGTASEGFFSTRSADGKIIPTRSNILHDYNLYNYNFTLLSLSMDQVANPENFKYTIFDGRENRNYYVVARSGGFGRANVDMHSTAFDTGVDGNPNRVLEATSLTEKNRYKGLSGFNDNRDKDIFIENVEFDTICGINNLGQSNLTKGRIRFMEPHGVGGLYEEMFAASRFAGHQNYIRAPFLLVITFVGRKDDKVEIPDRTTRHIPIMFSRSDMSVTESGATYEAEFLAYNQVAGSNVKQTLVDDVEGRSRSQETVESLLYHLFYQQNQKNEQRLKKQQEQLSDKGITTKDVLAERSKAATGAILKAGQSASGFTPQAFVPDRWCLWFARDYKSFPNTPAKGGMSYDDWKGKVEPIINPEKEKPGTIGGSFSNEFAEQTFSGGVLPSPNLKIDDWDKEVKEEKDKIDVDRDKINKAKSAISSAVTAYETQKKALSAQLKLYPSIPEELKSAAPDLKTLTTANVTKEELEQQNAQLTKIANAVATAQSNAAASADDVVSVNPHTDTADTPSVTTILKELADATEKVNQAKQQIKDAEIRLEKASKSLNTLQRTPQTLFGKEASPWSFKKGSNLQTLIDLVLSNSDYMKLFTDDAKIENIKNTEYIPWYRIEIIKKAIGFDVVKMDFSYEYHFIICPYKIHYSKFPGVNIVFSTQKLRENAVREYNYIYTGKNLDVLSFDIRYNNLFFTPLLLTPVDKEAQDAKSTAEEEENTFTPANTYEEAIQRLNSGISNKLGAAGGMPSEMTSKAQYRRGLLNNRAEIAQQLQNFLYNPPAEQALIRAEFEIIGDPVYIIGSGIIERPEVKDEPVVPDTGEMNTFTREPDIIFNMRFPDDTPTAEELDGGKYNQKLREGQYSGLYQVVKITNRFNEGVFTQNITGLRRPNQEKDFEE